MYPLLEQPLPRLCADRLDYFFRDSLACEVTTPDQVARFLGHLTVVGTAIAFTDEAVAREAAERFGVMNRDWWASPTEAYIYNEFADALREGFRLGVVRGEDLLGDDAEFLAKLRSSPDRRIAEKLDHVLRFRPEAVRGFAPRVVPKTRWLDPPVVDGSGLRRVSERG